MPGPPSSSRSRPCRRPAGAADHADEGVAVTDRPRRLGARLPPAARLLDEALRVLARVGRWHGRVPLEPLVLTGREDGIRVTLARRRRLEPRRAQGHRVHAPTLSGPWPSGCPSGVARPGRGVGDLPFSGQLSGGLPGRRGTPPSCRTCARVGPEARYSLWCVVKLFSPGPRARRVVPIGRPIRPRAFAAMGTLPG